MPYTYEEFNDLRARMFLAGTSLRLIQQYLVRRIYGGLTAAAALSEAREILAEEVPF